MLGVPLVRVLACALLALAAGLLFTLAVELLFFTLAAELRFAYTSSGLFKRCRKRRVLLRGRRNDVSLLRFPDRVRVLFLQ